MKKNIVFKPREKDVKREQYIGQALLGRQFQ
jgi:hypothetical protein